MTAREPLADIGAEARQVLAGCATHNVSARLIGGLAVAQHQHMATPLDRLCAVTSADWGWYTTLSDNLAKLAAFARDALAEPDRTAVTERTQAIQQGIDEPSKSLRWKARARIGRRTPWYELPEEVAGTRNG
jgi:hypothetical protein